MPISAQIPIETIVEKSDEQDLAADTAARWNAQKQVVELRSMLSGVEMEALVLSCVEEFSAREIGRIIGRSERAIHSMLHRAKTKARERLAKDE